MKTQKDKLLVRLETEQPNNDVSDLTELSVQILKLFETNERLTLSKIEDLTGANRNTIKVRLRELVNAGRISKHGKARATWYLKV